MAREREAITDLLTQVVAKPVGDSAFDLIESQEVRLDVAIVRQLDRYFAQLNGAQPHPLYPLVIDAVEKTLLVYVMRRCDGNQCKAAKLLGINRNTLHKKLEKYEIQWN